MSRRLVAVAGVLAAIATFFIGAWLRGSEPSEPTYATSHRFTGDPSDYAGA